MKKSRQTFTLLFEWTALMLGATLRAAFIDGGFILLAVFQHFYNWYCFYFHVD
jgi:hypothetical protein